MYDENEDFAPEDLAWVAADVAKNEEEEMNRALQASRVTMGDGVPPRPTSARAASQPEDEDEETLLALSVSRVVTEEADRKRNADAEADHQRLLEAQRQSEREAQAVHQEREDTLAALSISQVEAEQADQKRNADAEADQQRLLEAQKQSELEALAADQQRNATRKAELQSLKDERARAQAARLRQEIFDQAIVESKVAAETEQRQHEQQFARLQEAYAVRGLSEDEQLQMALRQSQDEEHSREVAQVGQLREDMLRWVSEQEQTSGPPGEPSATQRSEDRPVLGAMASYPPGPVTEQQQRRVADAQEFIDNPNVLYRPLTPISEASASRPASLRSVAADQARRSNIVTATTTTDHSRIDIRLPYPPGALLTPPASDRSRSSIRSVSSGRPPSYHTVEENPARRVESFEVSHDIPNESQTSEEPLRYPGAYPPSPSQTGSAAASTVLDSRPIAGTPLLPGAYPPSYASSRAPRSVTRAFSETPVQESVVSRRPLGNRGSSNVSSVPSFQGQTAGNSHLQGTNVSTRSESFPGAYPPSSQASGVPSRLNTVSSGGTFFTAQETQAPQRVSTPQVTLSDLWNHWDRDISQREGPDHRPFTPVSSSARSSEASSAIRPPSSRTSQGSFTRKPVARSQHATSVAAEHPPPATAADAVSSSDVISSGLRQDPVTNIFNAPVSVTINNFPEAPKPSQNLLKQVFNKSRQTNKGVKAVEQKGAEFYVKGVAEATSNLWKNKRKIFPARSSKSAGNAVINEAREIDRFPVSPAHDDVGTIASPWPARNCLHVVNADATRSGLSTPETTSPLQSELAGQQSEELNTPRPSTSQRSVTSPPPTAAIPSRPMSLDQWTVSQISDVNGNAVTPPSVCQSRVRSSMDSFRCASELRPQPLNIRKQPPPVPPKPLELASPSAASVPPPPPPSRSRNPMTRRMLSEQEEGHGWVQQPVHLPVINPTQGPTMGSPDSMTVTPPTPRRINVDLNRRSQFGPIDTSLANVPPGERRIDEFNSRSMMDLGMMGQLGNPAIMEPLRGQYEQTYARPPHVQQERLNSDARARKKEKDTQKALRRQF